MDLRAVFETMEHADNFRTSMTGIGLERTQIQLLQLLLDPFRGIPQNRLHKYVCMCIGSADVVRSGSSLDLRS